MILRWSWISGTSFISLALSQSCNFYTERWMTVKSWLFKGYDRWSWISGTSFISLTLSQSCNFYRERCMTVKSWLFEASASRLLIKICPFCYSCSFSLAFSLTFETYNSTNMKPIWFNFGGVLSALWYKERWQKMGSCTARSDWQNVMEDSCGYTCIFWDFIWSFQDLFAYILWPLVPNYSLLLVPTEFRIFGCKVIAKTLFC